MWEGDRNELIIRREIEESQESKGQKSTVGGGFLGKGAGVANCNDPAFESGRGVGTTGPGPRAPPAGASLARLLASCLEVLTPMLIPDFYSGPQIITSMLQFLGTCSCHGPAHEFLRPFTPFHFGRRIMDNYESMTPDLLGLS